MATHISVFDKLKHNTHITKMLSAAGVANFHSGIFDSLMPIMGASLFSGTASAGTFVGTLRTLQLIFFEPLVGQLLDIYGARRVMFIGYFMQLVAGIIWCMYPSIATILIYYIVYMIRSSAKSYPAYLLEHSGKRDGGLYFGLLTQIEALGQFVGIFVFGILLPYQDTIYMPLTSVCITLITLILLYKNTLFRPYEPFKTLHFWHLFIPTKTIVNGISFIKQCHYYPLYSIGTALFEGFYKGGLWFLLPLYIASQQDIWSSLSLGIYDFIALFFAGLCGYMVSKLGWRRVSMYSYAALCMFMVLMILLNDITSLVFLGAFIAITSNFFDAAASYALVHYTSTTENQGSFIAFRKMVIDTGAAIMPFLLGYLYGIYGFNTAFIVLCAITFILGVAMFLLSKYGRKVHV